MRVRAIMFALALAIASALAGGSLQRLRVAGAAERAASETTWVRYVMVGLGGFRGVISEVLWLRADRLQEQGRYFELAQLAEWINALDPRAADAWAFSAWNLAYNISAMTPKPKRTGRKEETSNRMARMAIVRIAIRFSAGIA